MENPFGMRKPLILHFAFISLWVSACSSCGNKPTQIDSPADIQATRDSIQNFKIDAQRAFLKEERNSIEEFAQNNNWDLEPTGTGLYIQEFKKNEGGGARVGEQVEAVWLPMLLNGEKLYNDSTDNRISWRVEKEEAVALGLHEVAKRLNPGDSARIVLPSHLAYGVAGLGNKVPMRSAIAGRFFMIRIVR